MGTKRLDGDFIISNRLIFDFPIKQVHVEMESDSDDDIIIIEKENSSNFHCINKIMSRNMVSPFKDSNKNTINRHNKSFGVPFFEQSSPVLTENISEKIDKVFGHIKSCNIASKRVSTLKRPNNNAEDSVLMPRNKKKKRSKNSLTKESVAKEETTAVSMAKVFKPPRVMASLLSDNFTNHCNISNSLPLSHYGNSNRTPFNKSDDNINRKFLPFSS